MSLVLENITKLVGDECYIDDISLNFERGSFNVLLGRTLAGKTTLMRLMAGLDSPTSGRILMNGRDMTGISVRKRNVSMVYQQFINYPNYTVFDNIASPLKLEKMDSRQIEQRVRETASMLHIEQYLDRYPLELSGGQQQRTAMARALVKDADLILLDEPLVNLDYKLREELRMEMGELFKSRDTIAIYATTEPNEALALGGTTTILHEGRVIQKGPTPEVYHHPLTMLAASLFSELPMSVLPGTVKEDLVVLNEDGHFPLSPHLSCLSEGSYLFGIRPHHLSLTPIPDTSLELSAEWEMTEISGSETFVRGKHKASDIVLHLQGVHEFEGKSELKVYLPIHKLFVFSMTGELIHAPEKEPKRLVHG